MKQQDLEKYNNINEAVYNLVPNKSKVLDIGCRNGDLGSLLINERQCIVDGVDFLPEVLINAKEKGYTECFQKDFNSVYHRNVEQEYDAIICADVLEHILYPERLLKELKQNISQRGKIIISIPNIGFVLYRIKHLLGFWDYEETGIMDKTHLKFYTLKTLKQMIQNGGYKIVNVQGYAGKNPKLFRLHGLAKMRPTMFAIQFICEIIPNED